jgi:hypothetical protein
MIITCKVLLGQHFSSPKQNLKADEMSSTYSTLRGDKKCIQNFSQKAWKVQITWKHVNIEIELWVS